jgi:uncharacterized membrane protein
MEQLLASGIPFELAGLVYFAFYLLMSRGPNAARFSQRSKVLTLVTAIVMVGAVPLHYGATNIGIIVMVGLALAAIISTWVDRSR